MPRCSKKALFIQDCLINMILSDSKFIEILKKELNNKWETVDDISNIDKNVLFGMIIGFQSNVLMRTNQSRKLYKYMKETFDYSIIGG